MSYEQIEVSRDGPVARITLNRPDKLNALTHRMSDELVDAFTEAARDPEVRALILTGAGRGFTAGQDLSEFDRAYRAGDRPDIESHLVRSYHRLIPVVVSTPKPVIAAVNGVAAGAGVSLAAACDVRIASEEARFLQAFVKIGLIPDSGGTWLLPRIVGYATALELSITGEQIDARRALEIRLVSRVVAADRLDAEVAEYASRLAALPTAAIAETKALMRAALGSDLDSALAREAEAQGRMGRTEDHLEGVLAFAEKREPRFTGR
ncbi:MAG TPA: enoyl-CoA hydratase-related protein [Actinomycetota bacterium]|nr:enoyl-CoA hydratase-related protein [Actinomycetota bacterium]